METGTKFSPFTPEQQQLLIDNWANMTYAELMVLLDMSHDKISAKAYNLRKKGFDLPCKPKGEGKPEYPIGHMVTNSRNEVLEKMPDGKWKYRYKVGANKRCVPIGSVRVYKGYSKVKTADGWKYIPVEEKKIRTNYEKAKKERKEQRNKARSGRVRQPKDQKPRKIITSAIRSPHRKKPEKALKLKSVESGGTWVRIDSRTIVYKKTG